MLILEKDGEDKSLFIQGTGKVKERAMAIDVLQSVPVTESPEVSVAIVNYVHKTGENIVLNDAVNSVEFRNDPYILNAKPQSVLCPPIRYKGKAAGIIYLENNLATNAFTPKRIEVLQILSAQAAISIENSLLAAAREKALEIETEMKIAAEIQTAILPKDLFVEGFEMTAYMQPADDVGGDYYDIINTTSGDWVIIGDVCGHGVSAGLVMMMVQTAFQAFVNRFPDASPASVFAEVNKVIMKNIQRIDAQKYMTATAFSVNADGSIRHAGLHEDILVYREKTKKIEVITTYGMWIGMVDDITNMVTENTFMLHKGDVMFLYTDGIVEAWKGQEMFGVTRLVEVLEGAGGQPTDQIREAVLSALTGYDTPDDVTMVILKKI